MTRNRASALAAFVLFSSFACKRSDSPAPGKPASPPPAPVSVSVVLAYGSEKKTWLEEQARAFEATRPRTKSGKAVRIDARAMGSGEAVQDILSESLRPHAFSPASGAYVTLLNERWLSVPGHTKPLCPPGEPVVLSPVVIAIWRPMAEALGWPAKQLGWANLLRVASNPKGWAAFDHPEWGSFKLGHTHPEFSNSGLLAIVAEAYAGAKKTRNLTQQDLDAKETRAFMSSVESSIVHYGKSTGFFAEKMRARGPSYLSAAVLYENLVIESYANPSTGEPPIVALYPVEGTFWSDHPFSIVDAEWVKQDEREGAEAFLAFLKGKPAQQRALELGFRPADASIPIASPVDASHGVDPKQPQTLLEVPDAGGLKKLLELWQTAKRKADVVMIFDKSGSMHGHPLAQAKQGARTFLESLHGSDQATLIFFDHQIYPPVGPVTLDKGRQLLLSRLENVIAEGGTALYDATATAYDLALARAREDSSRIHALVVMTDGRDEHSKSTLAALKQKLAAENSPVRVFTIAYGQAADPHVLSEMAEAAGGTSAKGSAETIVQVYQEIAAFF
jgi:Ca-activated chloride channel family protein